MAKQRATGGEVPAVPQALAELPDGVEPGHWTFWSLGRRIEDRVQAAGSKKAATRAVVAEEGCSYSRARSALAFAKKYPSRQVLVRLGQIRIRGRPLAEDHLRQLAMAKNDTQAEALLDVLERSELTSKQLGAELKRLKGAVAGTGGRKLIPPESLPEGLIQVGWWSDQWLKHHDALWAGMPAWLAIPEGAEGGADLVARLREEVDRLRRLRRAADVLEEKLLAIEAEIGRRRRRS
jgi:hypothetical protein